MAKIYLVIAVTAAVAVLNVICETPVVQCPGEQFDNLRENIQITPCGNTSCTLPKRTNATVIIKFTPKTDALVLLNLVSAKFVGIQLPFFEVNGISACEHLTLASTGEPASCPVSAGVKYVYSGNLYIEDYFPVVNIQMRWAVNDGLQDVTCFEVPIVITN